MSDKITDMIDMDAIAHLADLVAQKDLGEITITDGSKTITVKGKKSLPPMPVGMPAVSAAAAPAAATPSAAAPAAPAKPEGNVVKAPLVGTYYAAPSPDQKPFVQVGDTVKKGDVILIIESMKLMNEVQSDFDGVVKEILVQNGDGVEYDQPLMIIA